MTKATFVALALFPLSACISGLGGDLAYIKQEVHKLVPDAELIDLTDYPRSARELGAVVDLDSTGRLLALGNLIDCSVNSADLDVQETRIVVFNPQTRELKPGEAIRLLGGIRPNKSFRDVKYVTMDFDDAIRSTINEEELFSAVRDQLTRMSRACLELIYGGGYLLTGRIAITNVVLRFYDSKDHGLCALCDNDPLFEVVTDSGLDIREYRFDEVKIKVPRIVVFAASSDFSGFGERQSGFESFIEKVQIYDDVNNPKQGFWGRIFSIQGETND